MAQAKAKRSTKWSKMSLDELRGSIEAFAEQSGQGLYDAVDGIKHLLQRRDYMTYCDEQRKVSPNLRDRDWPEEVMSRITAAGNLTALEVAHAYIPREQWGVQPLAVIIYEARKLHKQDLERQQKLKQFAEPGATAVVVGEFTEPRKVEAIVDGGKAVKLSGSKRTFPIDRVSLPKPQPKPKPSPKPTKANGQGRGPSKDTPEPSLRKNFDRVVEEKQFLEEDLRQARERIKALESENSTLASRCGMLSKRDRRLQVFVDELREVLNEQLSLKQIVERIKSLVRSYELH